MNSKNPVFVVFRRLFRLRKGGKKPNLKAQNEKEKKPQKRKSKNRLKNPNRINKRLKKSFKTQKNRQ